MYIIKLIKKITTALILIFSTPYLNAHSLSNSTINNNHQEIEVASNSPALSRDYPEKVKKFLAIALLLSHDKNHPNKEFIFNSKISKSCGKTCKQK